MKVALIGNIYGNLPALEAVWNAIQTKDVDMIVNAGGSTVQGPFPNETLDLIQKTNIASISGKTDRHIARFSQKLSKLKTSPDPDKWLAVKAVNETLTDENRNYLSSFTGFLRLELEFKKLFVADEGSFPDAPNQIQSNEDPTIASFLRKAKSDIIVYAKGSRPAGIKLNGVWIFNTGSVGAFPPETEDCPKAYYTIIQLKPGFFQFRHYAVPYDILSLTRKSSNRLITGVPDDKSGFPKKESVDPKEPDDHGLAAVDRLLCSCITNPEILTHSRQVSHWALELFDCLSPLHGYTDTERLLLEYAALLHDIGWVAGEQGHHKAALNIISNTARLPFPKRERSIIGSVARYHRKSHPDTRHPHFASLEPADRRIVMTLAAILRVVDGLDHSHQRLIHRIESTVSPEEITLNCYATAPDQGEISAALSKGTLLEQIFGRKLVIRWNLHHEPRATCVRK